MSDYIQTHIACPCGKSSDAYSINKQGHGHCHSCNKHFFPDNNQEESMQPSNEAFTYEYLPRRGISKETHEFFGVKTQIDSTGKPVSVCYPHPAGYQQIKLLDQKKFWFQGENRSTPGGFFRNLFPAGSAKSITITEGADDGMSAWQMLGKYPVYPVRSSGSALSDVRADYDYLNSFEKIYLCLDDDEPGRRAAQEIASVFGYGKIYHVKNAPLKDATDFLEQKREKEFKNIWWNAKRWMPDSVISSFASIEAEIMKTENAVAFSWPFPSLQDSTGGLKVHKQYLVTGLEGTGKTELLHETWHHLMKTYPDLNIGVLHMEEPLLDTLTIQVGKMMKLPLYLPENAIPKADLLAQYKKLVVRDDRVHFFHHFGSEDTDVILNTIRFMVAACGCQVVFFDNYQHAVTGRTKDRDTEALDYLANRLEALVKELPFTLVAISHENDNELTRGSRNISKECDVWINMKRDIKGGSNMQLLTLNKGRGCRKTGPIGNLFYDQSTATLSEYKTEELPT